MLVISNVMPISILQSIKGASLEKLKNIVAFFKLQKKAPLAATMAKIGLGIISIHDHLSKLFRR